MSAAAVGAAGRLEGNRLWRVETAAGPVAQKLYARRGRWPREALRALLGGLARRKTSPRAAARRATERRLLALWRQAGLDVPAELSAAHPDLAGPDVLVLEWIEGVPLRERLWRRANTPRAERDPLLAALGAACARRHRLALALRDPVFLQEHGSVDHVLVSGGRLVTIDLEQAWRPGRPVLPLVAKELADLLRSLRARTEPEVFAGDLQTFVAGYDDDAVLRRVADEYLRNRRPLRRLLWAIDRRVRRGRRAHKYEALALLDDLLERRVADGV